MILQPFYVLKTMINLKVHDRIIKKSAITKCVANNYDHQTLA